MGRARQKVLDASFFYTSVTNTCLENDQICPETALAKAAPAFFAEGVPAATAGASKPSPRQRGQPALLFPDGLTSFPDRP